MAARRYMPGKFDLVVRRASAGLGLFARESIPKGACVIEYTGVRLSPEEEARSNSRYLFEVGPRKTIDGAPRWNTARYINHSCRPNCEIDIHRGRVYIFARRNIRPEEELSYDYGEDYFDEYINGGCRCLKCQPNAAPPGVKSTIRRPKPAGASKARGGKAAAGQAAAGQARRR